MGGSTVKILNPGTPWQAGKPVSPSAFVYMPSLLLSSLPVTDSSLHREHFKSKLHVHLGSEQEHGMTFTNMHSDTLYPQRISPTGILKESGLLKVENVLVQIT